MDIVLVCGPGISMKEPYNSGIESFINSFANTLVEEGHGVDVNAQEAEASAKFKVINPIRDSSKKEPAFFNRFRE